jgi:glycosyltransferase involved in cell wall biosynthesis
MARTYGFLSTYPPTQCGLAGFTEGLLTNLVAATPGATARVVRVLSATERPRTAEAPVCHLMPPGGVEDAAAELNRCDVAVVQHDEGIYGGVDGDDVLGVLSRLRVPVIVVLHTVPAEPTPGRRRVLDEVVAHADAVVTLSEEAARRLRVDYTVERPDDLVVIPQGAIAAAPAPRSGERPLILTWGLLRRGKGVEWAISALGSLRDLKPRYLVAGPTHPKVVTREGETYRRNLRNRTATFGVSDLIDFDPTHRDARGVAELVAQADVVLLPDDAPDLVTSAVLVEALVACRPVVATEFPHAVELLAGGAGLLVPHRNPAAIAAALRLVLAEPGLAARMRTRASRLAPALSWTSVADRYRVLAERLSVARVVATM